MSTNLSPATEPGPADYVATYRIVEGQDYQYQPTWPPGRRGCRYRVLTHAQHWPTGQATVVYVGLDGPDEGSLHCCSLANFAGRFAPLGAVPAELGAEPAELGAEPAAQASAAAAPEPLAATLRGIDMHHPLPDQGGG